LLGFVSSCWLVQDWGISMEATIIVMIDLPVSVEPGAENISFDQSEALELIKAELETEESKDAIISEINDAGIKWESDKAEFIFQVRRDAR